MADKLTPSLATDTAIRYVTEDRKIGIGMKLLQQRKQEFPNDFAMKLTGIGLDEEARAAFREKLRSFWQDRFYGSRSVPEIVIGSGFHAATYCAARVLSGNPAAPIVLERGNVGGTFAVSDRPTFYLNSRNRPGELALPGEEGALNYIPGAPIQPSSLSMMEFQTNAEVAFCIQVALAQYADVRLGNEVKKIEYVVAQQPYFNLTTSNGRVFSARRVIDARGLGDPSATEADGKRILTFPQFMERMAKPFPLQGLRRVAVIGNGDSAKCAVESLLGIGPQPMMALTSLDFVEKIDWYGSLPQNCDEWRSAERYRYLRIGRYLPRTSRAIDQKEARLRVIRQSGRPVLTLDGVLVNERPYDLAVMATGNVLTPIEGDTSTEEGFSGYRVGSQIVARRSALEREFYRIGPAADIPFSGVEEEEGISRIPQNRSAMFRLANRTAALAISLPRIQAPAGGF